MVGIPLESWPAVYAFDLADGLEIAFGAVDRLSDATIMQDAVNLTSPWNGSEYGKPWQIYLNVKPWRRSDTGEIMVEATPTYPDDGQPLDLKPRIPMSAAQSRNFSATVRDKDISRTCVHTRWHELSGDHI
jgi:hypothetical protein